MTPILAGDGTELPPGGVVRCDEKHPYVREPWEAWVYGGQRAPESLRSGRSTKRKRHISGLPANHPLLEKISHTFDGCADWKDMVRRVLRDGGEVGDAARKAVKHE